jgi:hypothetical protein
MTFYHLLLGMMLVTAFLSMAFLSVALMLSSGFLHTV